MTYDERTSKEGTAMNEKSVEQTINEMLQLQEGREGQFHLLTSREEQGNAPCGAMTVWASQRLVTPASDCLPDNGR